jgi:protoporphyrinogen oxidase
MALGPRPATRLLYPRRGISSFHARLADSITKRGGRILLESRVERFRADGGKIVGARIAPSGHDEPCDFVVWTGPLPEVCGLLGVQKPDLQYLSIVVFNISLRGKPRRDYQWIYYVDRNLPFNRVYNTSLFSAENAPPDHYGLCAEVSCRVDDEAWRDACSREDDVVSALESVALINREDVLAVHHEKLASAYPLYRINYREHQERGTLALAGFANLIVAGRTGRFWYNTMDQSIANALDVASQVREHLRESEPRKRGE